MSYIVCSNSTFDDERLTGISAPHSFQNHFKSPLYSSLSLGGG